MIGLCRRMFLPVYRCLSLLLYSLGAVVLLWDKVHFVRYFQRAAYFSRILCRPVCIR